MTDLTIIYIYIVIYIPTVLAGCSTGPNSIGILNTAARISGLVILLLSREDPPSRTIDLGCPMEASMVHSVGPSFDGGAQIRSGRPSCPQANAGATCNADEEVMLELAFEGKSCLTPMWTGKGMNMAPRGSEKTQFAPRGSLPPRFHRGQRSPVIGRYQRC